MRSADAGPVPAATEPIAGRRLDAIERRLADVEQEAAAMQAAAREQFDGELGARQRDDPWRCEACSRGLGYYDRANDVLRVKFKGWILYTHLGLGGFITSICWGCAHLNRLDYVEQPPAPPVR